MPKLYNYSRNEYSPKYI